MKKLFVFAALSAALWILPLSAAQTPTDTHDPKAQALRIYHVMQRQDWKGLYDVAQFSAAIVKKLPSAEVFAGQVQEGIDKSGNKAQVDQVFNNMSDIAVEDAVVKGNYATVPTSSKITINGRAVQFHGTANLIRVGDDWKWDLTSSDDPETATQTALTALLGKPTP